MTTVITQQLKTAPSRPCFEVMNITHRGLSVTLNSEMELATIKNGKVAGNGDRLPEDELKIHNVIDNIISGKPDECALAVQMNHDTYIRFSYDDTALIECVTISKNTVIAGVSVQVPHSELCEILSTIKNQWLMSRTEIAQDAATDLS
jgi:hypothetical protein